MAESAFTYLSELAEHPKKMKAQGKERAVLAIESLCNFVETPGFKLEAIETDLLSTAM